MAELFGGDPCPGEAANPVPYDRYGGRGVGLGWQDLLQPTGTPTNFLPDPRVWAILYSWRVPGFDIDGDGFVGVPNLSNTKTLRRQVSANRTQLVFTAAFDAEGQSLLNTVVARVDSGDDPTAVTAARQFDDFIAVPAQRSVNVGSGGLDGRITVDGSLNPCGMAALVSTGLIALGLGSWRWGRWTRQRG